MGLKTKFYVEYLKELINLTERKLKENMIAVFPYLKGYHREESIDLFFIVPEERRTNG